MWLVLCALLVAVSGKELTDEEYFQLPRLFHLDDYESCLAKRGGLYCLGSFHLTPNSSDDAVYNMMVEYSKRSQHFNRTHLHRGYCVSARCPLESERSERNESWRFERCVERWALSQGFHSTPQVIEYCRTTQQAKARKTIELDTPMIIFTAVVFGILFINVVGTVYDLMTPDSKKKNKLLVACSIRSNWRRLTASYEDGDPQLSALSPFQGHRVLVISLVIAVHTGMFLHMVYTHNTRNLENLMKLPIIGILRNGTSLLELLVVMSSFLLAYNVLRNSKIHQFSFRILPKIWLGRMIRLSPLHLLAVGFTASWWPVLNDGPMWYIVESSARACRRKFWTHALYLNNFIDPDDQCLPHTCVATLVLARWRGRALHILGALIAAATAANGLLAYHYQWNTMFYDTTAENFRVTFRGSPSFNWYYTAPWGSLPAALIGIFLAFLHFDLQEKGFNASEHKWLVRVYHCSIPLVITYVMLGTLFENATSRLLAAAFVALERPIFSLLCTVDLFGMINNVDNIARRIFKWWGLQALGRMTLAAMLLHWFLDLSLQASSTLPLSYSILGVIFGYVTIFILTYAVSVPFTIMVDMPFQRIFSAIFA